MLAIVKMGEGTDPLIPLSDVNYVLNDESIAEAKSLAREAGISEFNIIQMDSEQRKNIIYFGVVSCKQ